MLMNCANFSFLKSVQHAENCLSEPVPLNAGFIGQNVTLPCGGFNPERSDGMAKVDWYFKCPSCGVVWDQLAYIMFFPTKRTRRDYYFNFSSGTASVSRSAAVLNVLNFQAAHEGMYKCHPTGSEPYVMELRSAGEFKLQLWSYLHHNSRNVNNYFYLSTIFQILIRMIPYVMIDNYAFRISGLFGPQSCCMGRGIVLDVHKVTSKHPRPP